MSSFKKRLDHLSPAQLIVVFYFVAVGISILLLSLPITAKPGVDLSFLDIMFTAVSAISVTGLTVIQIVDSFSTAGIFILIFILQIGGIGIMTLGTFLWLILGKKIGLKERRLIMTDQNQSNLAGLVKLMKQILYIILLIELMGALILGTYFLKYYPNWQDAYLHGIFASVSATTNGGFDITGQSLIPYADDYFVQCVNIILITLGAIGFPVLIELKDFLLKKNDQRVRFHFSLYTKLTTVTFFGLMIVGTILILVIEYNRFFDGLSWHKSFFYAFFQSTTTRSGGLSTMDVSQFSEPTLIIICMLMFIGASPSSVGGGIRTTTFAINVLFLINFARGRSSIKVFRRELDQTDVTKSLAVTLLASFMCAGSVIFLSITESSFSMIEILFEVCSAFGTVGLSMGITPDLSVVGKILIMCLMFIGRIGLLTFLIILGIKQKETLYNYPKERVIIG
ncbi:TrkH family potassium uptake protein [Bacillus sp. SG-1]|uniref:TrkH family potassium uptake protein n=1 Tax=Bacillus sp. SG-1 TaxID=161544 RepID=UPI000154497E|nr:TrkH family potassium uptake protein [Bacillus sp. SG-1]EDL64287.1 YkrM [Bacillus sp. SG-1]